MNTTYKRNVFWVTLVIFASFFSYCQSDTQSIDVCLAAGNNCEACIQIAGCGYCGMYDAEGWCVPGNINGSTISELGADEECPVALWKFANGSSKCYEPQRFIEVEENTPFDKELISRPIPGNSNLSNAGDVITWSFSVEHGMGPNFTAAYSFQNGTTTGFYSIQTFWVEMFEFLDDDGGGFTCDYSNTSCSDAANIIRKYNLSDAHFTLQLSSDLVNQTTNFEKYQIATMQANFSQGVQIKLQCLVVNTNTSDSNQDYNPYESNCAFSVNNWPASNDPRSRFGIHGYILSESPISVSSDPAHKKKSMTRSKNKYSPLPSFIGRKEPWEYTVGEKYASLVWGDATERNSTVNGIGASITATELYDDDTFLPFYEGFKKSFVISFGNSSPQSVSWNPLYHITPFGFPGFDMDASGSTLTTCLPFVFLLVLLLL